MQDPLRSKGWPAAVRDGLVNHVQRDDLQRHQYVRIRLLPQLPAARDVRPQLRAAVWRQRRPPPRSFSWGCIDASADAVSSDYRYFHIHSGYRVHLRPRQALRASTEAGHG